MNPNIVLKIMDECGNLFDTLPDDRLTTWNFFIEVNNIVSKHKGVDCLMHINFLNGSIVQGMCVITDWKPGALVFQSDEGELPVARVIHPDEYESFMKEILKFIDANYPALPTEDA